MRLVTASCDLESFDEFQYKVGIGTISALGSTGFDSSVYKHGRSSLKVPPFSSFLFDIGEDIGTQQWYLKMWFRADADGVILTAYGFGDSEIAKFTIESSSIITWVGRSILTDGLIDPISTGITLEYGVWYELQISVLHDLGFGVIEIFANGNGVSLNRENNRTKKSDSEFCWLCSGGMIQSLTDLSITLGCPPDECACHLYNDPCWDRMQTAVGPGDQWFARSIKFGSGVSNTGTMWFDNVFINNMVADPDDPDNISHIPSGRMLTVLKPNGAGTFAQFTPDGGNPNWQNVDEVPVTVTDKNIAAAAGLIDSYNIENATVLIG